MKGPFGMPGMFSQDCGSLSGGVNLSQAPNSRKSNGQSHGK